MRSECILGRLAAEGYELDSIGSGLGPVAGYFEYCDEPSGSGTTWLDKYIHIGHKLCSRNTMEDLVKLNRPRHLLYLFCSCQMLYKLSHPFPYADFTWNALFDDVSCFVRARACYLTLRVIG
jgi:hypothetical protein